MTNTATENTDFFRPMSWCGDYLRLLDQRLLPQETTWLTLDSVESVAEAIRVMAVRGAPAIGIAAAYGMLLAVIRYGHDLEALEQARQLLSQARPTAVNLNWALSEIWTLIESLGEEGNMEVMEERVRERALAIHEEDIQSNLRMGRLGADLIESGSGVLTHCNTGSLATGGFGTALGVIRQAFFDKRIEAIFADETRPWLQGARLTAWELRHDDIPATLICDSAAAALMQRGAIRWVIVGADRIASNGDTANKIGTYSLAVLARYHGVRFMVVAPSSTIDRTLSDGSGIPIEERPEQEVLRCLKGDAAPIGTHAWNPVFDVTPSDLIDAIVTEKGVLMKPFDSSISQLFS